MELEVPVESGMQPTFLTISVFPTHSAKQLEQNLDQKKETVAKKLTDCHLLQWNIKVPDKKTKTKQIIHNTVFITKSIIIRYCKPHIHLMTVECWLVRIGATKYDQATLRQSLKASLISTYIGARLIIL